MVVPVVALVEGVVRPANSEGPELVLASEFAHHPENWNGRPVMMNHPQVDGRYVSANSPEILEASGIGHAFGSTVKDRALHTEAWIERDRALALGGDAKQTVERLDAGETIEVSVGVQLDIETKSGTHEGQDYEAVWRNVGPDHIAFLKEGDTGACSVQMGCGAQRAAQQSGPLRKLLTRVAAALQLDAIERAEYEALLTGARSLGLFRSAITDVDLRGALEIVLRDAEPGFLGILAVDDGKTVVYHAFADGGGGVRTYARSFKKRDSKITLNEDKQEVRAETSFISVNTNQPLRAACGCGNKPAASAASTGGTGMKTKAEMIAALIGSAKNGFTESDKAVLEGMTDERVKALFDHDAALTVAAAAGPSARKTELVGTLKAAQSVYSEADLQAMDEPALEKLAKLTPAQAAAPGGVSNAAQMTEADVRRLFPGMAAAADAHSAAQAVKKSELVATLKTAQTVYTEAQLNEMTVARLEEVSKLVGAAAPADYSMLGVPRAAAQSDEAALPDAWGLNPQKQAAAH